MTIVWIPVLLGVVAATLAVALGLTVYLAIRGEYLRLPDDKPPSEMDALTRLLGSFARFSVRSRRIIRALTAVLVLDLMLSAAFGFLAVEFESQRCVPYALINNSNAGIRDFLAFSLGRARNARSTLTPAQKAQLEQLAAKERTDFPSVRCP